MLATIFQLSAALILANFFAKYEGLVIPVHNQKPHNLLSFLENQIKVWVACLYLIIGYYIPVLDYDVPAAGKAKLLVFFLVTIGILLLLSICYLIQRFAGKPLYQAAPVFIAPIMPKYSIFSIIRSILLSKRHS